MKSIVIKDENGVILFKANQGEGFIETEIIESWRNKFSITICHDDGKLWKLNRLTKQE